MNKKSKNSAPRRKTKNSTTASGSNKAGLEKIPRLTVLIEDISNCERCDISSLCQHKVIYRQGPDHNSTLSDTDVLFVGEAPGANEYICEEPFIGPAGEELDYILSQTIHSTNLTYTIANSIFCTPFTDEDLDEIRTPSKEELKNCAQHLYHLYKKCNPSIVIALGKIAHTALTNLDIDHEHVIHPSGILQSKTPDLDRQRAVLKLRKIFQNGKAKAQA